MGIESTRKGNALEQAVGMIEKTLSKTNDEIKEGSFKIYPQKIILVDGERFEVDLYIEVEIGIGHKVIYIFECKNWKKPISNNEITLFDKKIEVTNAQRGYFVAKKFSKYAIQAAKKCKRIELLHVDDNFKDLSNDPDFLFNSIMRKRTHTLLTARQKAASLTEARKDYNIEVKEVIYNGDNVSYAQFLETFLDKLIDEKIQDEKIISRPEGTYSFVTEKTIIFPESSLIINGNEVEKIQIQVDFDVLKSRPPIISRFDIEKRGRVVTFEAEAASGKILTVSFIQLNPQFYPNNSKLLPPN